MSAPPPTLQSDGRGGRGIPLAPPIVMSIKAFISAAAVIGFCTAPALAAHTPAGTAQTAPQTTVAPQAPTPSTPPAPAGQAPTQSTTPAQAGQAPTPSTSPAPAGQTPTSSTTPA